MDTIISSFIRIKDLDSSTYQVDENLRDEFTKKAYSSAIFSLGLTILYIAAAIIVALILSWIILWFNSISKQKIVILTIFFLIKKI